MNRIIPLLFTTIVLIISNNSEAKAQSNESPLIPKIELHTYAGALLIHRDAMSELGNNPYFGNDLQIGFQTTGSKSWHELFKYPTFGLGLYSGHFNNNAIGDPFALYGFMEFPFYRKPKFLLSNSIGCGMTFNINEFDSISNRANIAIGSDRNVYIDFTISGKYKLTSRFEIGLGLKFQHFSNGAIKKPNLGLNMASGQLALTYYPWKTIENFKSGLEQKAFNKFEFTGMLAMGGKGEETEGSNTKYMSSTLSLCASKRLNQKRNIGAGIDVFYNEYIKNEFNTNPYDIPVQQLMSYGIFLGSDLIANKFRVSTQLGTYLWRKTEYSIPIYERVALRYYVTSKLFGNISIKAHGAKAEFIEWGFGVSI